MISSYLEKTRTRSQSRNRSEILSGVQQWSYYRDLAIESGNPRFSVLLV